VNQGAAVAVGGLSDRMSAAGGRLPTSAFAGRNLAGSFPPQALSQDS